MHNIVAPICLVLTLSAMTAGGEEVPLKPVLSVGQLADMASLPRSIADKAGTDFVLKPAVRWRSEVFPSTTPLPDTLNELPDIVAVYVGLCDNEISSLVEKGLIEPLNPVFEELGLEPKEILPPRIYDAVSLDGVIWALPHRVETCVVQYRKDVMKRLDIATPITSAEALLAAGTKISNQAEPTDRIPGLHSGFMPYEHSAALFMSLMLNPVPKGTPTFLDLAMPCHQEGVFTPPGFNWDSSMAFGGLRILLFRAVEHTQTDGVMLFPEKLIPEGKNPLRIPGYMECFAIRKTTESKRTLAQAFLKWLLSIDTQMAITEATALDKSLWQELKHRHVPVFSHVVESPEFQALAKRLPEYQVLVDACDRATFTPADPARFAAERERVRACVRENPSPEFMAERIVENVFDLMTTMAAQKAATQVAQPGRDLSEY